MKQTIPPLPKEDDGRSRRIVILAVPPAVALDITGPGAVFSNANRVMGHRRAYEIVLATSGEKRVVDGAAGFSLIAHKHYSEIDKNTDTLLVSGGRGAMEGKDSGVLDWLKRMASCVRRMGSICTGAFLLASAGLLEGKRATTHWAHAHTLAKRYPHVQVDPNPIWIQEGNIYTSAGVTSGMDLALRFVEEDFGSTVALDVARQLVLFLRRPGGQAQFSASLSIQASARNPFFELQAWMVENLEKDLSVNALASRVAMSSRNFSRSFVRELGITPARFVESLRFEAAKQKLEHPNQVSLEEIAQMSGFKSSEVMRRVFIRSIGITPGRYREHFGTK